MQPSEAKKKLNPTIISVIVIALLAIAAGGAYAATRGNSSTTGKTATQDSTTQAADSSNTTATIPPADTASTTGYTDGTYTETGSYSTPGGTESITVTATLANGTVTTISAKGSATRGDSAEYQSDFLAAYESSVVGKPINSVSLSRVAGSSLTSNGFNAAIAKIKSDALS